MLVDDVHAVRMLTRIFLERDERFAVVGEASDAAAGIAAVGRLRPDVVLVDLAMPGHSGLEAIPAMRRAAPSTRIAVLSAFPDPWTLTDALRLGADTYLDKDTPADQLAMALACLVEFDDDDKSAAQSYRL